MIAPISSQTFLVSSLFKRFDLYSFLLKIFIWVFIKNNGFQYPERKENRNKMRYLLGESMGGAVALLLHRKKPDYWDGAVLVAPMCKV